MIPLTILGKPFVIEVIGGQRGSLEAEIRGTWARCLRQRPAAAAEPVERVTLQLIEEGELPDLAGREPTLHGKHRGALLSSLTSHLTQRGIEARSGDHLLFHAMACAETGSGRAIALVGPSGTGKTTAAIALSKSFGYVTDETVAVRFDGTVVSYPKPLSVLRPGEAGPKQQLSPDALGLVRSVEDAPLSLGGIALLDRHRERKLDEPIVEKVPLMQALFELAPEMSYLSRLDSPLHRMLSLIECCGGVWRICYSEAASLSPAVEAVFAATAASDEWREPETLVLTRSSRTGPRIRRVPATDAVAIGDELCVMHGSTLRRLSGIAPFAWGATETDAVVDDLADALGDEFGRPNGWREALTDALDEMVAEGVLEWVEG